MTKKANLNPNEPNLFGFTHVIPAQAGIQFLLSTLVSCLWTIAKTNPIFLRPIMDFYTKNAEMEAK